MAEEHDVKYPAAALAYYAFVSQIPLLILVVAVISEHLVRQIRTTTPDFLTPDAQQLLSEALVTASGRAWAALLAVSVLAWSGANIVIGFQTAVNRVENTPQESSRLFSPPWSLLSYRPVQSCPIATLSSNLAR